MGRAFFAVFLITSLLLPTCLNAQVDDPTSVDAADPPQRRGRPVETQQAPVPNPQQQKELNKQRYVKLKADTDQLLKLATELKESVDRANQNTLSLDVIKKADQIEKLAKSVRDKMKSY